MSKPQSSRERVDATERPCATASHEASATTAKQLAATKGTPAKHATARRYAYGHRHGGRNRRRRRLGRGHGGNRAATGHYWVGIGNASARMGRHEHGSGHLLGELVPLAAHGRRHEGLRAGNGWAVGREPRHRHLRHGWDEAHGTWCAWQDAARTSRELRSLTAECRWIHQCGRTGAKRCERDRPGARVSGRQATGADWVSGVVWDGWGRHMDSTVYSLASGRNFSQPRLPMTRISSAW